MRIEKSIFQHIEFELYNYEETIKKLELHKEQILHSTSKPKTAVQAGLSDTTAIKAVKLSSSPFIQRCEEIINAVESSFSLLSNNHKKLFELKYIEGKDRDKIILEINISKSTYYRIREELVLIVGQKLGWIDI